MKKIILFVKIDQETGKNSKEILKNLEICLAAYNKKQEFFGGFIRVENFSCENSENNVEADKFSQIKTLNTIIN